MNAQQLIEQLGCSTIEEYNELQKMRDAISKLVTLAANGASMDIVADRVAKIFDAPVSVLDTSYSITAISGDFSEVFYPIYDEYKLGYLPDDAQMLLKSMDAMNPDKYNRETLTFKWNTPEGISFTNHFTTIFMNNIPIGSFSLFVQSGNLPDRYLKLLPLVADVFAIIIQRSDFYQTNKSTYYNHLLSHILDNAQVGDERAYEVRFSLFGYSLKKYKQIVVVDFSAEHFNANQVKTFAINLKKLIANSIYVVTGEEVVFVTSRDQCENFSKDVLESWRKLLKRTGMKMGVSSLYENITKTRTYLTQANKAIETGYFLDPQESVFSFDDYRVPDLITKVADDKVLFSFRYPPLMRLIKHDTAHNTNLAYTLMVFLQDPTTPAKACEQLYIHKNTLYYRLGKIREIMQTDFRSAEVIMQIQLTFHILKQQKKFDALVMHNVNEDHAD